MHIEKETDDSIFSPEYPVLHSLESMTLAFVSRKINQGGSLDSADAQIYVVKNLDSLS